MFMCELKGADQLCSYCIADLQLWFCISKLLVFSSGDSFKTFLS